MDRVLAAQGYDVNKIWQWIVAHPIIYVFSAIFFGLLIAPLVIFAAGSIAQFYVKYLALWGLS